MDYEEYDLGKLADILGADFPSIRELYLFGSRRYGTQSQRSDIDVLIIADEHLRPAELRQFAENECEALDLFLVSGAKAISTQNESFVEAEDFEGLVASLNAVKFWTREAGRLAADVNWTIRVASNISHVPSILPNTTPVADDAQHELDLDEITIFRLLSSLKWRHASAIAGVLILLLGAAFTVGRWTASIESRDLADVSSLRNTPEDSNFDGEDSVGSSDDSENASREPISLQVIGEVSSESEDAERIGLRQERNLRELTALESDRTVADTAAGTYFFIRTGYLEIQEYETFRNIWDARVERFGDLPTLQFELHYVDNDILAVICFVSASELASIDQLDGSTPKTATLFPRAHGESVNMVTIPLDRWITASERELDLGGRRSIDVLDVKLR